MCFYNDDYDWTAEVVTQADAESGPACKCDECSRAIDADEFRHTIEMQEHEACQICEDDFSDSFINRADMTAELDDDDDWAANQLKILDKHTHDYGETYSYVRCLGCEKLLKAIEKREELAGCPAHSRRPPLSELWETMREIHEAKDYAEFAVKMFPELVDHPIVVNALQVSAGD